MSITVLEIVNEYITFYKAQINNVNLFEGINFDDANSTNHQMELLNKEMLKFNTNDEKFSELKDPSDVHELKKYTITKNNKNYKTSNSLIAILFEMVSLKNEDFDNMYSIKMKHTT